MKKIFNNRKLWTGMSVILTISSVGLLVRWLDISPIEEDWVFCYCLEENETGCTECPTECLLHKINGMNKCIGPKSSLQVDPILSNDCTGTKPTNSVANNWTTYPISASWTIYARRRYAEQPTDKTCTYHCKEKYHYYIDWRTESCKANACWWSKPDNSTANSSDKPEIDKSPWNFQASWTTPCSYHCNDGYEYNSSTKTCDEKEETCFFCQFKTNVINNILSWGVWDRLMDELDRLFKVDWSNVIIETIPSWAIMAFNLTECPEWWTRFDMADGRFLMWVNPATDTLLGGTGQYWGNVGTPSNKNQVVLGINHLPSHSHQLKYRNENNFAWMWGSEVDRWVIVDRDSEDLPDGVRRSSNGWDSTTTYIIETSSIWRNDSFDITNAHVKVLYCIKN